MDRRSFIATACAALFGLRRRRKWVWTEPHGCRNGCCYGCGLYDGPLWSTDRKYLWPKHLAHINRIFWVPANDRSMVPNPREEYRAYLVVDEKLVPIDGWFESIAEAKAAVEVAL